MNEATYIQVPMETKKVSFQTQQSILTGSSRKRYYLKKQKIQKSFTNPQKSNIFDLTSTLNSCSEINSPNSSLSESRQYTNSLFTSLSREKSNDNPEARLVLPIITESKYQFRPALAFPRLKMQEYHEKAPVHVKRGAKIDEHNMKQLKKYKKLWAHSSQLQSDKSLLQRSVQKSDKQISKHNSDFLKKKASIEFETILRDRHLKQENRIGVVKGVPNRSLPGIKGKGGSVRSLFEEMYAIQQVYKISK